MYMKQSWLVQRVDKPWEARIAGTVLKENPFSFGGGLRRGGLSQEVHDALAAYISWDYMGAAEYEFGALPEAMQRLLKSGDVAVWPVEVKVTISGYLLDKKARGKAIPKDEKRMVTLWAVGPSEWRSEISQRLIDMCGDGKSEIRDSFKWRLAQKLVDPEDRFLGGIELDNGWWFFVDRDTAFAIGQMFGAKTKKGEIAPVA